MTIAIYPGSFDPITNGHIDLVTRASKLFDKLYIGIFATPDKNLTFTVEERVELAKQAVAHLPNVDVKSYTGLTTDFAREMDAGVMVRGLRIRDDFEREFDSQSYGGVPILGINGVSIIGHGHSTPKAIKNAIGEAIKLVETGFIEKIKDAVKQYNEENGD